MKENSPIMLRLAIQKSGRLQEDSLRLLKECGIRFDSSRNQLRTVADNFPLELYFLRNSDIPTYVQDSIADIAIIGTNTLAEERDLSLETVLPLGFSKCRLSLAVPRDTLYEGLTFFEGKRIATSYPNSLQAFLAEHRIQADIHTISGSVEIAPNIGLAEGICDLVSSGNTLFINGLKEVEVILKSEAALIKNSQLSFQKQAILNQLLTRIKAVMAGRNNKYILLNAPNDKINDIIAILPGMKSPTIVPLVLAGWSSLHSVIHEQDFWEIIDQLKVAGAEGILVVPIEKMVT
jgi:ATP phosphoribosyltransferase